MCRDTEQTKLQAVSSSWCKSTPCACCHPSCQVDQRGGMVARGEIEPMPTTTPVTVMSEFGESRPQCSWQPARLYEDLQRGKFKKEEARRVQGPKCTEPEEVQILLDGWCVASNIKTRTSRRTSLIKRVLLDCAQHPFIALQNDLVNLVPAPRPRDLAESVVGAGCSI